jgi:hypothetical protein
MKLKNNMAKKFSELNAGDSVWIWWFQELYEYGIQDIVPVRTFMHIDGEEREVEPSGEFIMVLKGGASYHVFDHCIDREAFIWGSDGWHEYKILGTSKEAVKECLEKNLESDKKKLEEHTKEWLSKF